MVPGRGVNIGTGVGGAPSISNRNQCKHTNKFRII